MAPPGADVRRKADAGAIAALLADLPRRLKLDARRAAWPRYAYHYTDVRNAARVLAGGALLSRERCAAAGVTFHDAANREVIEQSRQAHHYVRLYFRPRTPTQYHMEGIKAPDEVVKHAHCPVPVFFLFDAPDLLGRRDVWFSDGSLARRHRYRLGGSADFLAGLPFDAVYHDAPIPDGRRDDLVFRRHAEVLVRDSLGLDTLLDVVCRSGPERTTLLDLLGDQAPVWADCVRLERPDEGLFFRRGMYVTGVSLINGRLAITTTRSAHQFPWELTVARIPDGAQLLREVHPPGRLPHPIAVDLPGASERVAVELPLGDALAFRGPVTQRSLF